MQCSRQGKIKKVNNIQYCQRYSETQSHILQVCAYWDRHFRGQYLKVFKNLKCVHPSNQQFLFHVYNLENTLTCISHTRLLTEASFCNSQELNNLNVSQNRNKQTRQTLYTVESQIAVVKMRQTYILIQKDFKHILLR